LYIFLVHVMCISNRKILKFSYPNNIKSKVHTVCNSRHTCQARTTLMLFNTTFNNISVITYNGGHKMKPSCKKKMTSPAPSHPFSFSNHEWVMIRYDNVLITCISCFHIWYFRHSLHSILHQAIKAIRCLWPYNYLPTLPENRNLVY
jgi:hypothetical protein